MTLAMSILRLSLSPKRAERSKFFRTKIPLWVHGGHWWVRWLHDETTVNSLGFFFRIFLLLMEGRDCFQNKKIISSISSFVIILGVNFARYSELDQCFLSTLFNLDFFCHPVETYDIIKIGWSDEALNIPPKKKFET